MTRLNAEVVRVADPEVASVPPCAVVRNCAVLTPWLVVRYFKNKLMSPLNEEIVPLVGKNEYTLLAPFDPKYKFHVWPANGRLLTIGTACPAELN